MMHVGDRTTARARTKQADLASGLGAGILGAGLGALAGSYLGPYAVPLLAIGAALHAWGMLERHRLDGAAPRVWWAEALYWLCWALLAVGALVLARL